MIDLDLFAYEQIDSLLLAALQRVDAALPAIEQYRKEKDRTERYNRSVEGKDPRSQEQRDIGDLNEKVQSLLSDAKSEIYMLASNCDALTTPLRKRTIVNDLTAIAWLYQLLIKHADAAKKTVDKGNTAYLLKCANEWSNAIRDVGAALKKVDRGVQEFSSSLGGIAALEMVLSSALDRVEGEVRGDIGYRRLALADAKACISSFLSQARLEAVTGKKGDQNLVERFDEALARESETLIDHEGVSWAARWSLYDDFDFDEFAATAVKKSVFSLFRVLVDINGSRLMEWAEKAHADIDRLIPRDTKGARIGTKMIVPSPEMAMVWALCRLVDGWKPRSRDRGTISLIEIEATDTSFIVKLAREILFDVLGDKTMKVTAFASPMVDHGSTFLRNRDRGGRKRPFYGRRATGDAAGEFVPDALDQPEAIPVVSIKWPDPTKVPQSIKAAALSAAVRAKNKGRWD